MHISGNQVTPTHHGITVKSSGYGYGGGISSSKNVSFDYVPGHGMCHPDNYAVYVNAAVDANYSPATTTSVDSCNSTVKVGSLATHV